MFTFAIFRGHDSRFILENNIGCSVLGKQETGRLYQQTEQLNQMGIKLTYSGDQPFLLRLIMGISKDDSNEFTSKIPLYVGRNDSQKPISTDPVTQFRTNYQPRLLPTSESNHLRSFLIKGVFALIPHMPSSGARSLI